MGVYYDSLQLTALLLLYVFRIVSHAPAVHQYSYASRMYYWYHARGGGINNVSTYAILQCILETCTIQQYDI